MKFIHFCTFFITFIRPSYKTHKYLLRLKNVYINLTNQSTFLFQIFLPRPDSFSWNRPRERPFLLSGDVVAGGSKGGGCAALSPGPHLHSFA